jgi:arylsulfatase A-like enzyme
MQDYLACVQSVDTNVGRLLDFLEAEKLSQNTVVIYTSDQGFFLGEHGLYDKRFMYEPSARMPLIVKYPQLVKPGGATSELVINPDFAPTMMALAGMEVPAAMQGKSIVPLLKNEPAKEWRKSFYYRYYHDPGDHNTAAHYGVRTQTHKLIYFWKQNEWELYDLVNDPEEMRNLAGLPAHAELLASMKAELDRVKKEAKDDDQFADQHPSDRNVQGPKKKNPKK